jgi:hypothetical protein
MPQSAIDALSKDAHEVLWRCVAEAGISLGGRKPGIDAARAIIARGNHDELARFQACQVRVLDEVGLPGWVG